MKPLDLNRRTGEECKKTDCVRYKGRNVMGGGAGEGIPTSTMVYCMECKWAYKSQWKKEK